MEYDSEAWLGYDHQFHQNAAATVSAVWAKINATLWNKTFTGQAKAQRCQFCFSLTHKSKDCDWANTPSTSRASKSAPIIPTPTFNKPTYSQSRQTKIYYTWNHSPEAACLFPKCAYQHICLNCPNNNQIVQKDLKVLYCRHIWGTGLGNVWQPNPAPTYRTRRWPLLQSPLLSSCRQFITSKGACVLIGGG